MKFKLFFLVVVALLVSACGKAEQTSTTIVLGQPGSAPVLTTIDLNNIDLLLNEYERLLAAVVTSGADSAPVNSRDASLLTSQVADLGARLAIEIVNFNQQQTERFESINQRYNNASSDQ